MESRRLGAEGAGSPIKGAAAGESLPNSEFRAALDAARGRSEFAIVVIADIRGFSKFSQQHESPDVAMFIKRVYKRLIDDYFPFACFWKPTGDGLLMTIPYDEETLQARARETVASCFKSVEEFGSLCDADAMINFATPSLIGFGVARGTVCCLVSEERILDYSGHLLNLASRLMDLARPSGVVLQGSFGIQLLDGETRGLFEAKQVYLRSVAETEPTEVHVQKGVVEVPLQATRPLAFEKWETFEDACTLRDWKERGPVFLLRLPSGLKRPDGLDMTLMMPQYKSGKQLNLRYRIPVSGEYVDARDEHFVRIDCRPFMEVARRRKVPLKATVTLKISYIPARDE